MLILRNTFVAVLVLRLNDPIYVNVLPSRVRKVITALLFYFQCMVFTLSKVFYFVLYFAFRLIGVCKR